MKTNKIMVCLLACISYAGAINALEVASGPAKFYTTISQGIEGTEKYSYSVGNDGSHTLNGPYSFVGKFDGERGPYEVHESYSISANMKDDELDGTYSQKATYVVKIFDFYRAKFDSYNGYSSYTGTFKKGIPDGSFSFSFKDEESEDKYSGSGTYKNGSFVGGFKYNGCKLNFIDWNCEGQFSQDSKYIGQWKCDQSTYTFQNNVLISIDDGKSTTSVEEQNLAKKYAEGKISKEELLKKGYIVKDSCMQLKIAINFLYKSGEFGFVDIKRTCKFAKIKIPRYECLIKLSILNQEQFDYWVNDIFEHWYDKEIKVLFNEEYQLYGYKSHPDYRSGRMKIAYTHTTDDPYFETYPNNYITKEQYNTFLYRYDSVKMSHAKPFIEYINQYNRASNGSNAPYNNLITAIQKYQQGKQQAREFIFDSKDNCVLKELNVFDKNHPRPTNFSQDKTCFGNLRNSYLNGYVAFDSVKAICLEAVKAKESFGTTWDSIHSTSLGIYSLCEPYKKIYKEYSKYSNDSLWWPYTYYEGYKSCVYVKHVLAKQQAYKDAINIFDQKTKQINSNNAQLLADGKAYKQLLKVYQTYMKGADITWKGIGQYATLDEVLKNQEIFSKAFKNAKVANIDAEVKNSDKSLSTVLGIIAKY